MRKKNRDDCQPMPQRLTKRNLRSVDALNITSNPNTTKAKEMQVKKPEENKIEHKTVVPPESDVYELSPLMTRALESELNDLMYKVYQTLPKDFTDAEKKGVEMFRGTIGDSLRNTIGLNVTKRLLLVNNSLYVKMAFLGQPQRADLAVFLKKYNIASFKRVGVKGGTFIAKMKNFHGFDTVCTTKPLKCGNVTVNANPCYQFTHCPPNLKTIYNGTKISKTDGNYSSKKSEEQKIDNEKKSNDNEIKTTSYITIDRTSDKELNELAEKNVPMKIIPNQITNAAKTNQTTTATKATNQITTCAKLSDSQIIKSDDIEINKPAAKNNDAKIASNQTTNAAKSTTQTSAVNTTTQSTNATKITVQTTDTAKTTNQITNTTKTTNQSTTAAKITKTTITAKATNQTTTAVKTTIESTGTSKTTNQITNATTNQSTIAAKITNSTTTSAKITNPTTTAKTTNQTITAAKTTNQPVTAVKTANQPATAAKTTNQNVTAPKTSQTTTQVGTTPNERASEGKDNQKTTLMTNAQPKPVAKSNKTAKPIVKAIQKANQKPTPTKAKQTKTPVKANQSLKVKPGLKKKESDYDELDDYDILALLSGGIVLDECSGTDEDY